MVKRVLAMLVILIAILAVTGCGSSGSVGDEELQKAATPVIAPKGEKYFLQKLVANGSVANTGRK